MKRHDIWKVMSLMKGHPYVGIYIEALILIVISSYSFLLLNIFAILKWIIAYCPIYIGYLHSEVAWFTTFTLQQGFHIWCPYCIIWFIQNNMNNLWSHLRYLDRNYFVSISSNEQTTDLESITQHIQLNKVCR